VGEVKSVTPVTSFKATSMAPPTLVLDASLPCAYTRCRFLYARRFNDKRGGAHS